MDHGRVVKTRGGVRAGAVASAHVRHGWRTRDHDHLQARHRAAAVRPQPAYPPPAAPQGPISPLSTAATSGVRVWARTVSRTRCACSASAIGTRIVVGAGSEAMCTSAHPGLGSDGHAPHSPLWPIARSQPTESQLPQGWGRLGTRERSPRGLEGPPDPWQVQTCRSVLAFVAVSLPKP
jgi:hypothetical protein